MSTDPIFYKVSEKKAINIRCISEYEVETTDDGKMLLYHAQGDPQGYVIRGKYAQTIIEALEALTV